MQANLRWWRLVPFALGIVGVASLGASGGSVLKFAFGPDPTRCGFTRVAPDATYSAGLGDGFEPGAKVAAVERGGVGFCTSEAPFFFSVAVPEGNYRVTIGLAGDAKCRMMSMGPSISIGCEMS